MNQKKKKKKKKSQTFYKKEKKKIFFIFFKTNHKIKHKSKMTGDRCVIKFLWCSVDGKHLMRFRNPPA